VSKSDNWGFETRAILKGQSPDPSTGATIVPIYQTSTFTLEGIGKNKGYCYSRTGNPTRSAAAECLASLEDGKHGFIYPSGIAAINSAMQLFKPGDHIVTCDDLYGGAHRLFTQILSPLGMEFSFADARSTDAIIAAIRPNTKLVWLETPSNPMMYLCDIAAVVERVTEINKKENRKILVACDNTFASPYIQRPLNLGVDLVMHSCTKYLGGHSDLLLGALITNNAEIAERLAYLQNATGAIAGPFDCWLLMRGMKTLAVRMKQHHSNALTVAKWLEKHPRVLKVNCPALESSPQHALYKKQMALYNGMLSFELDSDFDSVKAMVEKLEIFQLAESLGGVESLICHPPSMTHAAVPVERRLELGIKDTLIRLSIGIEDVNDLISDLENAFASLPERATAAGVK